MIEALSGTDLCTSLVTVSSCTLFHFSSGSCRLYPFVFKAACLVRAALSTSGGGGSPAVFVCTTTSSSMVYSESTQLYFQREGPTDWSPDRQAEVGDHFGHPQGVHVTWCKPLGA